MLIYNAEIHTMDSLGVIANGWIETENGKIKALGEGSPAEIPADSINAQGGLLMPGFIDAHTHLGIIEDGLDFEGDDCNEATDPFTPQMRAIDGINPFDRCFEEARMRGITAVASSPGSANACGGEIAAIKTNGRRIDDMLIKNCGIKFALGENPKNVYNGREETPVTRMAITALIREGLYKARRYVHDMDSYYSDSENYDPPEYDIKCEALMPLLERKIKAFFHCHRADDICTAMRIASEFALDPVIIHGTEGHKIADIIAEEKIPVICGPIICDRCKPEMRGLELKNASILHESGAKIAICTDHTVIPIQYLPLSAQAAVKGGLSFDEAIKTLTVNPAEILGIDDTTGSLRNGKDADLQLYRKGDNPLDLMCEPVLVMVSGDICRREV
ncbi:amidohydrolase [Ruminococcus flavefaciens]|uniref:amidohydrolase n=1 Tax=Ruminococcus flavefaciens TaxID=1265 RepID=UPI0026EC5F11|nr:amidohydrolase [Ruminococcus flavefaciens]MDD7517841.1 amidohydrolase [Ruminococcus flavefaciens]MDY5691828.1 amidohydrolase [Ruminococcus flavefaciens]